jgi:hypothetical protein
MEDRGFCVVQLDDEGTHLVERFDSPYQAQRGLWIFTAHELKNGRKPNYSIRPPVEMEDFNKLNLPDWALEVLKSHELQSASPKA